MVKHIVIWKLHAEADGRTAAQNAELARERLEALAGRIPGLRHIEVGVDFLRSPQSGDLVLYTEMDDRDALETYQQHPEHQALLPFMKTITCARQVIDYER